MRRSDGLRNCLPSDKLMYLASPGSNAATDRLVDDRTFVGCCMIIEVVRIFHLVRIVSRTAPTQLACQLRRDSIAPQCCRAIGAWNVLAESESRDAALRTSEVCVILGGPIPMARTLPSSLHVATFLA
jgi:hypothetical protein